MAPETVLYLTQERQYIRHIAGADETMGLISVLVQCTLARESGGGALEIEGATEKRSAISSPSEGV